MNVVRRSEKARGARLEVEDLVYVQCEAESAFLLNVSDCGMAIQAMEVLEPGRSLDFSFPLPDTQAPVEGRARIVWSDRSGRAGLQFVDLSPYDRLKLTSWVQRSAELMN